MNPFLPRTRQFTETVFLDLFSRACNAKTIKRLPKVEATALTTSYPELWIRKGLAIKKIIDERNRLSLEFLRMERWEGGSASITALS